MSSGSHPTANDVRMDRRDPRHERRPAHSHHRAEHPDPRQRADHSGERHGAETAKGRPAKPTAATKPQERGAFTVGHAGRQVRIGPVAFWTVVGSLVSMAGWSAMTATYFAFQDDVLARMISHEAELRSAYEDRIAEMRAQVDRVTSRQLLDQEQFDQKLDQIMLRQTALESRATALGTIPDVTGSIRPAAPARGTASAEPVTGTPKPNPISDTVIFVAPPDREARLESRAPILSGPPPSQFAKNQGVDSALVRLQNSLDQVENRQLARPADEMIHFSSVDTPERLTQTPARSLLS